MNRLHAAGVILLLGIFAASAPATAEITASEAFEGLKTMAGDWHGTSEGQGEEAEASAEASPEVHFEIKLSAAGTVVMETMGPGTEHEMINMYHLDGEDLVLTHYCAGGNQPTMKLDRAASSADELIFGFTGGTNLDPAVDEHIHSAEIRTLADGKVDSRWTAWSGGAEAGVMVFHLERRQ